MNYTVKGVITSISEKKVLDNGASVLDYVVEETDERGYKTLYNIGMYKKAEHLEHMDNFIKYNAVGDTVEVEFTIRGQEYNGKVYNNLNHWKLTTLVKGGSTSQGLPGMDEAQDPPF